MKDTVSITEGSRRDALREQMSRQRQQLSDRERKVKDSEITKAILRTTLWKNSDTVFAYSATEGEPDLTPVMEKALSEGKTLALPTCMDEKHMVFSRVKALDELVPGMYGIREPARREQMDEIRPDSRSLMLIPCLAWDDRGYRLGHGKGYYDRYLASAGRGLNTVITAYHLQRIDRLPVTREDMPAAWIATEEGVMPGRQLYGY